MAMFNLLQLALGEEEDRRINIQRVMRPNRIKSFDLPEVEFVKLFRLNKSLANNLIEILKPALEPKLAKKTAFSPEIKVLTALRFFATGAYQKNISNDIAVSMCQQSASKVIREVAAAINNIMLVNFIKFPTEQIEINQVKADFYDYCNFPGVIGAIDCTHVAIIAPPDDETHMERNYVNRKGFHSLNVQLVTDANSIILNINARFPGCSHDSYIWKYSNLRRFLQLNALKYKDSWLLGDSGYPLEENLMTPYDIPTPITQHRYNKAHKRGRCVIERTNGILKSRFRCLLRHRALNYSPETAARIINACAVLHNMCVEAGLEVEEIVDDDDYDFTTDYLQQPNATVLLLRERISASFI